MSRPSSRGYAAEPRPLLAVGGPGDNLSVMQLEARRTLMLVPLLAALGCASGGSSTNPRGPLTTATTRPVEFEAYRGAYSFEFVTEETITVDTIQAAPAAAWRVLPRAFEDLGLPAGEAREGTTTYGVPRASVRRTLARVPLSRFMRCGATMGVPNADSYDVTLSLISRIVPLSASATIVQSQLVASARQTGVVSNPLPCTSTRDLERRVARLVEYHAVAR